MGMMVEVDGWCLAGGEGLEIGLGESIILRRFALLPSQPLPGRSRTAPTGGVALWVSDFAGNEV